MQKFPTLGPVGALALHVGFKSIAHLRSSSFVFYTQSPNTQDTHSPRKGASDLAPNASSGSLLTGRPAANVTASDCRAVSAVWGRQHTVQAQEGLRLSVRPPPTPQAETTVPSQTVTKLDLRTLLRP